MNNEKFRKNILDIDDLDKVAGGTVKELSDLCSALAGNRILGAIMGWKGAIPVFNQYTAKSVSKVLLEKFNIKAKINLGFAGTGRGEGSNAYWDMGTLQGGRPAFMTHEAVIARIKEFKG